MTELRKENPLIQGINTALVTPLMRNEVDVGRLRGLVEYQLKAGVDGLVVCATTGEGSLLTERERRQVIDVVVDRVDKRVPVIVGMSYVRIDSVLDASRVAADAGATACLVPSPAYIKPSQEGIYRYYAAIADQSPLPIILYNVPSRTASDILPQTVGRLAPHEQIVGIKEATGSIERVQGVIAAAAGRLSVLSGDDPITLSLIAAGGQGVICTGANATPQQWVALWRAWNNGDLTEAAAIQASLLRLHHALFTESNPGPVKMAVHLLGLIEPEIRLPLTWAQPQTRALLVEELERLGYRIGGAAR